MREIERAHLYRQNIAGEFKKLDQIRDPKKYAEQIRAIRTHFFSYLIADVYNETATDALAALRASEMLAVFSDGNPRDWEALNRLKSEAMDLIYEYLNRGNEDEKGGE